MIDPGQMNKRVELQTRSTTQDSFGSQSTTWTTTIPAWARIEPLSGRALEAAKQLHAEVTHRVTIRYRPGITAAMRLKYGARLMEIGYVLNPGETNEQLQLLCTEGVSDG